jgi:hypothetical protein
LALERVIATTDRPELDIDCEGLEFINHRALLVIDRAAARAHTTVRLVHAPRLARRIVELLPLPNLRLVIPA